AGQLRLTPLAEFWHFGPFGTGGYVRHTPLDTPDPARATLPRAVATMAAPPRGVRNVDNDGDGGWRTRGIERPDGEPLPLLRPGCRQHADVRRRLLDRHRRAAHHRRRPRHLAGLGRLDPDRLRSH